jgi:HEAT repeat protein
MHYMDNLSSPDPQKRLEAVNELGEMVSLGSRNAGNPAEVAKAIRPLLKDPDPKVREEVLVRLRVMGDEDALLEMLTPKPSDEHLQPNWGWTIAGWAKKDTERVPKQVLSYFETDDPRLHEFALAFFSCYKMQYFAAQPHVARLLKSPLPAVRAAAASAIRFTCDQKQAVDLLCIALDDTSEPVLVEALKEANWFNGSIPVERITRLLGHKSPEVREQAAYALDCCRDPRVVEPLLTATRDPNPKVRAQAAVSLGRIGNTKAYSRLLEMLADETAEVRESAINGLRWLGKAEAIPAIKKLQDDPNENVRQMARRTVRELQSK